MWTLASVLLSPPGNCRGTTALGRHEKLLDTETLGKHWLSTGEQQVNYNQRKTRKTNQIYKGEIELYACNHKCYHLRETVAVINPL